MDDNWTITVVWEVGMGDNWTITDTVLTCERKVWTFLNQISV